MRIYVCDRCGQRHRHFPYATLRIYGSDHETHLCPDCCPMLISHPAAEDYAQAPGRLLPAPQSWYDATEVDATPDRSVPERMK